MIAEPSTRAMFFAGLLAIAAVSSPARAVDPAKLFKAKCASCHGVDGLGNTESGKKLGAKDLTSAAVQKLSDAEWKKAIREGKVAEGKKEGMDAFSTEKLTDEQLDTVVAYVRTLAKPAGK